ncbi:ABC transporter substrate-binding protein [Phytoactinopolyspora mesophila]|uniref:ABC transporter substrate-binding protein n=1 Tax=Phytoactinopolyspora mesophila TaxID=2650750 RepID=A0A7K3MD21_9ACTN|nr:ABC transporter substrate-binding protein [Phytoactinopolyspora mesophila]NDL60298.1 ABC transporter substrate-binding protein [Phytoactinopolyspora mesophila]
MRRSSKLGIATGGAISLLLLAACGGDDGAAPTATAENPPAAADDGPLTIENCGIDVTVDNPPERAVTLNKPVTEILLALGLKDRIAAVAGEPDEYVAPQVADDFAAVEILVDRDYPSLEALLDLEPDFVYASYPSAYRDDALGSRDNFTELGIPTYLSVGRCENEPDDEAMDIEDIWFEIEQIGAVFGVEDAAADLVTEQRQQLEDTLESIGELPRQSVFWWDMNTDAPFAGACCGAPAMIIETLGFENIFDDLGGHWADTSWEQVIERDPDLIVIADFGDGDIDTKLDFLHSDPTLSQLRAVQDEAIVTLPFAATTPGIQTVTTVGTLADAARESAAGR